MREKKTKKALPLIVASIISFIGHVFLVDIFFHIKFTIKDIFSEGREKKILIKPVSGRILQVSAPAVVKKSGRGPVGITNKNKQQLTGKRPTPIGSPQGRKKNIPAGIENRQKVMTGDQSSLTAAEQIRPGVENARLTVDPYKIINSEELQDDMANRYRKYRKNTSNLQPRLNLDSVHHSPGSGGIVLYGRDDYIQQEGYDITPWGEKVINKIYSNWYVMDLFKRADTSSGEVGINIEVNRQGRLMTVRVGKSSTNSLFDSSALNAVTMSVPLPPFPDYFPVERLKIFLLFKFNE